MEQKAHGTGPVLSAPSCLPALGPSPGTGCAVPSSPSSLQGQREGLGTTSGMLNPFLLSWAQAGGHEATSSCWGVISRGRKQGWSPVPQGHSHPSNPQLGPS